MENLPGYDSWLESPYQKAQAHGSRADKQISANDNYAGYCNWLSCNITNEKFELYCFDHFWNQLKDEFESLLHPDAVDPNDPLGDNWPEWSLFLWVVLDHKRLEILMRAFVNSNRDEFEAWVLG